MKIQSAALCIALAFAPACHKADPAEKSVQMMEDLGDAADKANGDCAKLADLVKSIAAKYQGDLAAMKALDEKTKTDKDAQKALEEKYSGRLEKAMPKLMKLLKCADDATFKAAAAPLDGLY
ncbi:MAG TPA: hypothetical protein VH143_15580 [Kofleriaceae bacterium]|jgi:hypothetical protein|nr:hypothetical protein [Kofleriaceae bacterium]